MNGKELEQTAWAAVPDNPETRLASLFDRHNDRLYRLARRLCSGTDDAGDLVQDTFLKAARSLQSIPTETYGEEAWLVRVLVNTRRDQWRRQSVRKRHSEAEFSSSRMPAEPRDTEAELIVRASVWQAVERLAPRRRAIVVLSELEGLRDFEIASLLGIQRVTVRWHLRMGRRDLHLALRAHMGGNNEKS